MPDTASFSADMGSESTLHCDITHLNIPYIAVFCVLHTHANMHAAALKYAIYRIILGRAASFRADIRTILYRRLAGFNACNHTKSCGIQHDRPIPCGYTHRLVLSGSIKLCLQTFYLPQMRQAASFCADIRT